MSTAIYKNNKIRIGLVGYGRILRKHFAAIEKHTKVRNIEVEDTGVINIKWHKLFHPSVTIVGRQ